MRTKYCVVKFAEAAEAAQKNDQLLKLQTAQRLKLQTAQMKE